jgi:hypothetical protein
LEVLMVLRIRNANLISSPRYGFRETLHTSALESSGSFWILRNQHGGG